MKHVPKPSVASSTSDGAPPGGGKIFDVEGEPMRRTCLRDAAIERFQALSKAWSTTVAGELFQ